MEGPVVEQVAQDAECVDSGEVEVVVEDVDPAGETQVENELEEHIAPAGDPDPSRADEEAEMLAAPEGEAVPAAAEAEAAADAAPSGDVYRPPVALVAASDVEAGDVSPVAVARTTRAVLTENSAAALEGAANSDHGQAEAGDGSAPAENGVADAVAAPKSTEPPVWKGPRGKGAGRGSAAFEAQASWRKPAWSEFQLYGAKRKYTAEENALLHTGCYFNEENVLIVKYKETEVVTIAQTGEVTLSVGPSRSAGVKTVMCEALRPLGLTVRIDPDDAAVWWVTDLCDIFDAFVEPTILVKPAPWRKVQGHRVGLIVHQHMTLEILAVKDPPQSVPKLPNRAQHPGIKEALGLPPPPPPGVGHSASKRRHRSPERGDRAWSPARPQVYRMPDPVMYRAAWPMAHVAALHAAPMWR
mmetsp:Transcript_26349/g.68109  ORF Transcript_26349/g.68109 Transcript_26349/m.68109 type:complete len:414 (-) Transcript_26349:57-1298(-)